VEQVALVSGANRGIGAATAQALACRGWQVWIGARDLAQALEQAKGIRADGAASGGQAHPVRLDVTDDDSVTEAVAQVEAGSGRLDALVNNAAVALDRHARPSAADLALAEATLAVNVLGVWRLTLAALPLLRRASPGRIVNVSSAAGSLTATGTPRWGPPAYRVSKTALNGLTQALAADLAGQVLVNAVCPGWVRTQLGGQRAARTPEQAAAGIVWAAELGSDGPTGGFYRDSQPLPW
jgi:NAD(P)-dependent dehydrogenase (short-subunit alcohol dehydrogenase family)